MSRFSHYFRDTFPNKVASHFGKYIEYVHPVTFDPIEDIYRQAFKPEEWDALNTLLSCGMGRETLTLARSFDLYLPERYGLWRDNMSPAHITFRFPDNKMRPGLRIETSDINHEKSERFMPWIDKAIPYAKLKRELYKRVKALLDWGWESAGCNVDRSVSGPTPGQGCNTIGQVQRIWPELIPFFPPDMIARARNASAKSRLPKTIMWDGEDYSPEEFMMEKPRVDDGFSTPSRDFEFNKRRLAAINHILVQISLLKDTPHPKGYPVVHL